MFTENLYDEAMGAVIKKIKRLLPIARRRLGAALLSRLGRLFSSDKLVRDIFGTQQEKRVLMCHLPEAFDGTLPKYHTNYTECYTVAQCFHKLGYSVDCASRAMQGIDYSGYDIIFGINGEAFMGSFDGCMGKNQLHIFYTVGAQLFYSLSTTVHNMQHFYNRHGRRALSSYRYLHGSALNYYAYHLADDVICLGNDFVKEQYVRECGNNAKFHSLPAFFFPCNGSATEKDFSAKRRNILWFGSAGMLHKGLDIAIDFVCENPQFTLHICGGSSAEREFWKYYKPIIDSHENIIYHGFVDIEEKTFVSILDECAILLNPSINEAGAAAVLNVLGNSPMLPVYSKGTGLDLEDYGIEVPSVTYENFSSALREADEISDKEFERRAYAVHHLVNENYTLEQYALRMYDIIENIVNKKR